MGPFPERASNRSRRGSTWPDLLAVLVVIGILIAITVPMMLSARLQSSRARCIDNLREISNALNIYAENNMGRLPSTRPSHGPVVTPDVSNSGYAAANPFSDDGPAYNNVPAALFLLVRAELLKASDLVCPGTNTRADAFDGKSPTQRSNFTDVNLNLSYALQNPYANDQAIAEGFQWRRSLPANFVLVADRGPSGAIMRELTPGSPPDRLRLANSPNHNRQGQNVLYADGRVEFLSTPFAGIDGDQIYLNKAGNQLDSPLDATDSVLLPGESSPDPPIPLIP
jgi:type II secretory pathway pseudopilin PulG